jgi:hypothetical protein
MIVALACTVAWGCAPGAGPSGLDASADTSVDTYDDDAPCTQTEPFCSADFASIVACNLSTGELTTLHVCGTGEGCVDGVCIPVACLPNSFECLDEKTLRLCNEDGSSFEDYTCPGTQTCNPDEGVCEEICKIRIFILLDKSGSMAMETPSRWMQARFALETLMTSDTAADVQFGFGIFPSYDVCGIDAMIIHPVPAATSEIVDGYFDSTFPAGGTPLVAAMQRMLSSTDANLDDPTYHNAILIVSDGYDSCHIDCDARCESDPHPFDCIQACEEDIEEMATPTLAATAAALRDDRQIRTFVIGFGGDVSDSELSALAMNGGTAVADWIPAADVDTLTAALATILDEMWQCNDIII